MVVDTAHCLHRRASSSQRLGSVLLLRSSCMGNSRNFFILNSIPVVPLMVFETTAWVGEEPPFERNIVMKISPITIPINCFMLNSTFADILTRLQDAR